MYREPNFPKNEPEKKPSESDGKISEMRRIYRELEKEKGKTGADFLMDEIIQGKSDKKVSEKNERMIGLEEARGQAFQELERMGFIFRLENGQMICDTEKIKSEFGVEIMSQLGPIYENKYLGGRKIEKTLSILFQDAKAISKKDWEGGEKTEKDLVYFPKNKSDALNLEKIRSSNFHLTLADMIKSPRYENIDYGNISREDLDFREVILPVLIYHPEYGNGYRDEKDGKIYIIDKKTNQPKRLNSDYIVKNWGVFGSHGEGENFAYPTLFIKKYLPHLAESGLLKPEDFTARKDTRNRNTTGRSVLKIKSKGQIWFDGMHYMTGAECAKVGKKAYQLSESLGGVVDEEDNLLFVFDLFEKNEKFSRTPEDVEKKYYQVRKSETKPREFHKEDFFVQKPNESQEDYKKRVGEVAEFKDVLEVSDKVLVSENINLAELDFKNQLLIATLYKKIGEKKFMEFVHEYRLDGLRSCVALENGNEMEKVILKIGNQKEKDPQFSARMIFRKYNKIISERENLGEIIGQMVPNREFEQEDFNSITNYFEKKAQKILEDFSKDFSKLSVDEVENRLDSIQKEMLFLGSVLTFFKEQKGKFSIEDIRNVEISEISGKEVLENSELIGKLREMYCANNSHKSKEDLERLMSDFEKHLEYDAKFHMIYFDQSASSAGASPEKSLNSLVGFMRSSNFDGMRKLENNERYLGAMNIDPLLQKFYFGENFLRETIKKEFQLGAQKIVAHMEENKAPHKIMKGLGYNYKETPAGDYKKDDGSVSTNRLLIELTKK